MCVSNIEKEKDMKIENLPQKQQYQHEYVWRNIFALLVGHIIALYGFYILLRGECKYFTLVIHFWWTILASLGITAGAHRLWAHKSYKAKTPLKIFYAVLMSMNFANDIFTWARDHRAHHKYSETDADPHNSKRGFFFAHMGWLMVKKHPAVIRTQKTIDYSDLSEDPVVAFHRKYYGILMPVGCFVLPTIIPWLWGQTNSFPLTVFRYFLNIHVIWSLNSVSHLYGTKPYNKNISPTFNRVMAYAALGEGFHNYHHSFPWDYKASELSGDPRNMTTYFIEFCARHGWAYDLKKAKVESVRNCALKYGDGTWKDPQEKSFHDDEQESDEEPVNFWGWGDPDITDDIKNSVQIKI